MKWKRVSSPAAGTSDDVEPCPTADCHCNEAEMLIATYSYGLRQGGHRKPLSSKRTVMAGGR